MADSVPGALEAVALQRPEAAIVDLILPDGDGVQVLEGDCASRSEMPVLVLSAVGDEAREVRALEAGADDYVTSRSATRSWSRA